MKVYSNKALKIKEEILLAALKATGNDVEKVAVGIFFVSPWKIKKFNKVSRNVNKVTDVLSFPMFEGEKFDFLAKLDAERDPFSSELYLGEIMLCARQAKKQAKEFGHSYQREVNFLALHGFLHLLGFDHLTPEDEEEMQALAEKILSQNGLERGEDV